MREDEIKKKNQFKNMRINQLKKKFNLNLVTF